MRETCFLTGLLYIIVTPPSARTQTPVVYKPGAGWIGALACAPDGRTLAVGAADGSVRLIDPTTAAETRALRGHTDRVCAVAYSPDGKTLVSAGYDKTAQLWNTATGELIGVLQGHRGVVTSMAFAPDGDVLITGSIDATAKIWEVASRRLVQTLQAHTSWVNAVAFSPEGMLVTASSDNTVRLWEKKSDRWIEIHRFAFPEGEVRSLAISPEGKTLVAGLRYGVLKVIDLKQKAVIHTQKPHIADVWAVAFAPDGRTVASGDGDWDRPGDVRLWDTANWKERKLLKTAAEVLSMAFDPRGRFMAAGCWDGSVHIWPVARENND